MSHRLFMAYLRSDLAATRLRETIDVLEDAARCLSHDLPRWEDDGGALADRWWES